MNIKYPKYRLIKEELQNQILNGHYHTGDKFYTEAELIKRFHVSSITIIRALKELEKEGFIRRRQGLGTFITRTRKEQLVQFSYLDTFKEQKEEVTVLSVIKGNDPYYLNLLKLHKTEFYYTISRTRTINQQPYLYQLSYIPHDYLLCPERDLTDYQSLYKRFFLDYHIQMRSQSFTQQTQLTDHMPKDVATFLNVIDSTPCVLQTKLTRSTDNSRILEYTESYKHWQFFKYALSSSDYQ